MFSLYLIFEWGKFYPKIFYPNWRGKVIHRNKSGKNFYPEVLSKIFFIQKVRDLFYLTLSMKIVILDYATYSTLLYQ